MNKPFSQACENNKAPILSILKEVLVHKRHLLEIGSGTGQHASFFAPHLPFIKWQTSDLPINHAGINQWIDTCPANNLLKPLTVDLNLEWPTASIGAIDSIFTANTLHIVSWDLVEKFFEATRLNLAAKGILCIYGPFKYNHQFTSESNARFDLWLKDRDSQSGVRDIEAILALAEAAGLSLRSDVEMPANNRLLVFDKAS